MEVVILNENGDNAGNLEIVDEIFKSEVNNNLLYEAIKNELAKANMKKDVQIIDEVLPLIEEIRDMWYEVDRKIKSSK